MRALSSGPGIRTRVLLLVSLFVVVSAATAASLWIVRTRLQKHVEESLSADLQHSLESFQDLEARRRSALQREDRLLASLPSLKALMTSSDPRTIADDAVEFWHTSGNDLFALAYNDKRVVAYEAEDTPDKAALQHDIQEAIGESSNHYLLSNGHLYEYSVEPIYFGSPGSGTLLGYVISGYAIDHAFLQEIGRGAGAQAAFIANKRVVVSTWPKGEQEVLERQVVRPRPEAEWVTTVGDERFLTMAKPLTAGAGIPLSLLVMKSFIAADRAQHDIDRLLLLASLLAISIGSVWMVLLARFVTRPLEQLASGVRAFGEGDTDHSLPSGGTLEVRYLSRIFAKMRDENQRTHRALLESERLATIGRMASSVSHDLRHYLAAVYANAEFLASPAIPEAERAELFEEIRLAVNGTTDMLDALLIFGRSGSSLQRIQARMHSVVERAIALVRTHPDAERVTFCFQSDGSDTTASMDTRQVERAIYNLLLNGCQSARQSSGAQDVRVRLSSDPSRIFVSITDTGPGVPDIIRNSLFDPFVSQGKQKGTGLGLTLAFSVARDHDGDVQLVSTYPGETVFRLTISRGAIVEPRQPAQETGSSIPTS